MVRGGGGGGGGRVLTLLQFSEKAEISYLLLLNWKSML